MTRLARTVPVLGVLLAAALLIPSLVSAQHFPEDEDLAVMLRYLVEDGETPGIVLGVMERDGSSVRRASKISGRTPPPREVAGNAREQGLAVTAEDMARYAGTYALQGLPAPVELRMWGRNGVLMAQTPPQNEEPLDQDGREHVRVVGQHQHPARVRRRRGAGGARDAPYGGTRDPGDTEEIEGWPALRRDVSVRFWRP